MSSITSKVQSALDALSIKSKSLLQSVTGATDGKEGTGTTVRKSDAGVNPHGVTPRTYQLLEQSLKNDRVLPWEYDPKVRPPVGTPRKADQEVPALFQPLDIKSNHFKNRIVVSPMCQYSSPNGHLTDWHLAHLGQFAMHGAAAVIIEATSVTPNGRISQYDSGIWLESQIEPMRRVVNLIHSQNALVGLQLAHAGRKASTQPPFFIPRGADETFTPNEELGWTDDVVGASAIPWGKNWIVPKELSKAQIKEIQQAFVDGAKRVLAAGVDFIEIHAAHGYLFSSWLSPLSNTRTDEYGGSTENRSRFLFETIEAVQSVYPKDKALWVRISCDEFVGEQGWTLKDTLWLAKQLYERYNVDVIDCSAGGNNDKQQFPPLVEGYQVKYAEAIKRQHPDRYVATVGSLTDAKFCNQVIAEKKADLVLVAREFLRKPSIPLDWAAELGYDVSFAPQYARAKRRLQPRETVETQTQSETGGGLKKASL